MSKFDLGDRVRVIGDSSNNPAGELTVDVGSVGDVVAESGGAAFPGTVEVEFTNGRGNPLTQWVLVQDLVLAGETDVTAHQEAIRSTVRTLAEVYGPRPEGFVTKDSGERAEYPSGMVRDTQDGKERFDLLFIPGVPYAEQPITRVAALMTRGANKYGTFNWTLANSEEELSRFKASAARHFAQWITGETDEDHMAAVWFNIQAAEHVQAKLKGSDA